MKQLNLVNCVQESYILYLSFELSFNTTERCKQKAFSKINEEQTHTYMERKAQKKKTRNKIYFCFRRNFITDIEHVEPIFLFAFIVCNDVCASYTIHVFMWSNQFFFSVLWFWDTLKWKRIICDNRWKIYCVTEKYNQTQQNKKIHIDNVVEERMFTISFSLVQL